MKDWNTLNGKAQSEALLNEIKGNIFEFLLATHLCRHFGVEGEFLRSFSSLGAGRALEDLKSYQEWLRGSDPELYRRLPQLADEVGQRLVANEGALHEVSLENIYVTGKAGAVSGQEAFKEADLWLKTKTRDIPLSLKLCKKGAFVNTKSGGIRSFITKYFSSFSKAEVFQDELNQYLEQSFSEMAQSLYEWADLSFEQDHYENFKTQFSPAWVEHGFSELPGELPLEARQFLFAHYHRVISKLYGFLKSFFEEDKILFGRSLGPLVGMSLENMVQVTCFHNETKEEGRYQLAELQSYDWQEFIEGTEKISLEGFQDEISSFEISLGSKRLQIRVKPMNKFTVSALKVNCSLKDGGH